MDDEDRRVFGVMLSVREGRCDVEYRERLEEGKTSDRQLSSRVLQHGVPGWVGCRAGGTCQTPR